MHASFKHACVYRLGIKPFAAAATDIARFSTLGLVEYTEELVHFAFMTDLGL